MSASLLDPSHERAGPCSLPLVARAGLHFPKGSDPIGLLLEYLRCEDIDDPERLRELHPLPGRRLIVRSVPAARWGLRADRSSPARVLRQALLLGLCSTCHYDPVRPVLWTRASVDRRLEFYDAARFYA